MLWKTKSSGGQDGVISSDSPVIPMVAKTNGNGTLSSGSTATPTNTNGNSTGTGTGTPTPITTNGNGHTHARSSSSISQPQSSSSQQMGVVIYPFQNYKSDVAPSVPFLSLDLGDSVVISGTPFPGWYFGWRKYHSDSKGIFPCSHIALPKRYEYLDFLDKVSDVCREWGEIRKKLFVDVHLYQFDAITRGIFELIEGRRAILNQSLTQDQYRELTRRLCSRIDWGNRKLSLDLVPWNFLIEQEHVSSEEENSSKILPELNRDAGKLFKLHQKSVDSSVTRGSNTISRPKSKKELKNNDLYVSLRDFSYSLSDDCEISFSLFDGKFISEKHVNLHKQLGQSSFHMSEERPTVFKDVGHKRDLYLVVQIVRIGRMFYAENSSKNKLAVGRRRFRRPYACGVLSLNDVETLGETDELEFSACKERGIKLYTSDEKDFWQVHELIVTQNYRNIVSKIIPVLNSFSVSVFWCGSAIGQGHSQGVKPTRLIGQNNLIAPPGVVRNDLYFTLGNVELQEKKQNKTGGAKSCNLEVEIQVIDDDDDVLLTLEGNCYRSLILHHVNNPKYNETVKFAIPIEIFPKAKVRLLFRHCSTKDKTDKKMFGVSWMSLMDPSGTTVKDGEHQLQVWKWTDENSLPVQSTCLNLSKDVVNIATQMVSTKFTQKQDLVSLLKWKQMKDLKPSLQNLISSQEATEEIVRNFLHDVLDALFTIFSGEDGSSTEYSGDVFTLLVNIFQLLRLPNYSPYKSVLNTYCSEHFAATLVYKGLLQSLKHYTNVLLNSARENVTEKIQNCYSSLQLIFKFVVQSQLLFAKATGGHLDDSFKRDVNSLVSSFCLVFASFADCSPVFIETQSILLQNLHSVYEELLRVMSLEDVCDLVCQIFNSIPVKETAAHPLSPAKLSAIHQIVKSSLFKNAGCRARLLPVICKHIRHHLAHREELKLVTDVLSEILMFLHDIRDSGKGHADIEVVCTTTLEMLVQSVLVLERTSSIVNNLVTCLISLLEQMDNCHYNRLWDEFHERKPLRDLLLRVFLLFRDLIKHEVFPTDWAFMKLLVSNVMLQSLQEFCQPLITDFLKFFDIQLYTQYFALAVTFITQPGLRLETMRERKREWVLNKYGDMRGRMSEQMLGLWRNLGDQERRHFIPGLIGPFLEVTMIPQPQLRLVTLQTFFYDMMQTEYRLNGEIRETESELIDKLDLLLNSQEEGLLQRGDCQYRLQFREIHLNRLASELEGESERNGCKWPALCTKAIESLSNLQQLLLDYREVAKGPLDEENRDKLMQCTVNLLNFYREEGRQEQYFRYVYKLHDLHMGAENFTEAGFTLLLHGQLLKWDMDKMLPECSEPGMKYPYPRQREGERKELIYIRVLGYFDQGKVWEKGITLCKELAEQYEKKYDYNKLSRILQTQATFYDNILNQHRPEPGYFRVGFFGQGYPLFVRNKEFIYRGQEYERLGAFIQRILAEWPKAQLLQNNSPPEAKILEEDCQYLQICNVKPKPGSMGTRVVIPEKIRSFYQVNDVSMFQYDRRIEKPQLIVLNGDANKNEDNEFKTMWIERTTLKTSMEFPGTLKWLEIIEKCVVELSPIEFACEKMEEANHQLVTLMGQFAPTELDSELRNVNPLSMRLQGMLDAAVMGGIPKYTEAFFNEDFLRQEEFSNFALKLISLLQEQVKLLEDGLEIHGRLVPPGVQPLHKRLLECHLQMKSSVQETELMIHSTLASFNNATLRRSESGNSIIIRDSFRKLGGGKSIVNSPLPPVPKYCPNPNKLKGDERLNSSPGNSNRSSISSGGGGGYGHVTYHRHTNRDLFDDDDDDVYSQPVDDHLVSAATIAAAAEINKPPLIPSRVKKGMSVSSVETSGSEYIIMPPQRLREINDKDKEPLPLQLQTTSAAPPPIVPPKPKTSSTGTVSPPPPLLPRKPSTTTIIATTATTTASENLNQNHNSTQGPSLVQNQSMSKTNSTTSLNSSEKPTTPPPVPPKPSKANGSTGKLDEQNTYMNKAELQAEMDTLNRNRNSAASDGSGGGGRDTPSRKSHKEFFVPPGARDRNSAASN